MSDSDGYDPAKVWRDWYIQNERSWSEIMTRFMKMDQVSDAMGKEIDAAVMGQQMLVQGMAGPMAAMNLPTREDVEKLGERIGALEDSVARIEALLTRMAAKETPRTKGSA